MRRLIGATGAAVLMLVACTSGDDDAAEPLVVARSTTAPQTTAGVDRTTDVTELGGADVTSSIAGSIVETIESTAQTVDVTVAPTTTAESVATTSSGVELPNTSVAEATAPVTARPRADEPREPVIASGQPAGGTVDPADLVDEATAEQPTNACGGAADDESCPQATYTVRDGDPSGAVSAGEYERSVALAPDDRLDIYLDQSRPTSEMPALCAALGGTLVRRLDDGSPWAGWYFCADVDH